MWYYLGLQTIILWSTRETFVTKKNKKIKNKKQKTNSLNINDEHFFTVGDCNLKTFSNVMKQHRLVFKVL